MSDMDIDDENVLEHEGRLPSMPDEIWVEEGTEHAQWWPWQVHGSTRYIRAELYEQRAKILEQRHHEIARLRRIIEGALTDD